MGPWTTARLAWRNLWRNPRRTLITLSSIAFAGILAVVFTGMQDASWTDVINLAARLGGGHVTVQHPEYLDKPALSRVITDVDRLRTTVEADPRVRRAVPRVVGQVMLATATDSVAAGFLAVDPAREDVSTLSVLEAVKEGALFTSSRDRGVVLGARLAHNLGAGLGDKVVYTLTDRHGEIVSGLARVTGLLRTGSPGVDLGMCLLPLDSVRDVLGYGPQEATQLAVFLRDHHDAERLAPELTRALGNQAVALTWQQTQPDLAAMISVKRGGMVFFELLMLVLAAAGIFNTLLVSVMERLREFGILLALGMTPRQLSALVMLESAWLSLAGLAAGVVLGALPYAYLGRHGIDLTSLAKDRSMDVAGVAVSMVMRVAIEPVNLISIALAVVLGTLAAGLYPAWRAGRVEPVESIKLV